MPEIKQKINLPCAWRLLTLYTRWQVGSPKHFASIERLNMNISSKLRSAKILIGLPIAVISILASTIPSSSARLVVSKDTGFANVETADDQSQRSMLGIWATLGGKTPIANGKLTVTDADGVILAESPLTSNGGALINTEDMPDQIILKVDGGTVKDIANPTLLRSRWNLSNNSAAVAFISPVTEIAYRIHSKQTKLGEAAIGNKKLLNRVLKGLNISPNTPPLLYSTTNTFINRARLASFIEKNGGIKEAFKELVSRIFDGKTKNFSKKIKRAKAAQLKIRSANQGSASLTASPRNVETQANFTAAALWVGESVAAGALGWMGAKGMDQLFPAAEDPNTALLKEVIAELQKITQTLATMQQQMDRLELQGVDNKYQTIYSRLVPVIDVTTAAWASYTHLTNNFDAFFIGITNSDGTITSPLYPGLQTTAVALMMDDIAPLTGSAPGGGTSNWENLWTNKASGSVGVLEQLYELMKATYPAWWSNNEVEELQASVAYFGLLQGQSLMLSMQYLQYKGKDQYTIDITYNKLVEQSRGIEKSYPDDIDSSEIVNGGTSQVLSLAEGTFWTSFGHKSQLGYCDLRGSRVKGEANTYTIPDDRYYVPFNSPRGPVPKPNRTLSVVGDKDIEAIWDQIARKKSSPGSVAVAADISQLFALGEEKLVGNKKMNALTYLVKNNTEISPAAIRSAVVARESRPYFDTRFLSLQICELRNQGKPGAISLYSGTDKITTTIYINEVTELESEVKFVNPEASPAAFWASKYKDPLVDMSVLVLATRDGKYKYNPK